MEDRRVIGLTDIHIDHCEAFKLFVARVKDVAADQIETDADHIRLGNRTAEASLRQCLAKQCGRSIRPCALLPAAMRFGRILHSSNQSVSQSSDVAKDAYKRTES